MRKPDSLPVPEAYTLTHVVCPDLEEAFQQAQKPEVNLVVCQRVVDASIASFIQRVYHFSFPSVSLVATEGRVKEQLHDALVDYVPLHREGAFRLTEDMAMLTNLFIQ